MQVDPATEYHTCQQCKTSAFVRSPARMVPPDVQQQGIPVLLLSGGYTWTLPLTLGIVVVGLATAGIVFARSSGAERWSVDASETVRTSLDAARTAAARVEDPLSAMSGSAPSNAAANAPAIGNERDIHRPEGNTPSHDEAVAAADTPPLDAPPKANFESGPSKKRQTESQVATTAGKSVAGKVTTGKITVSGRLSPDSIRKVVGGVNSRFRMCYERGLQKLPTLSGNISARFVIGRDGSVSNVSVGQSDLPDSSVNACVLRSFYGLQFTPPEGGIVTVTYPLRFFPA
jgi:outer membrane biosynthesis protein TonB